MLVPKAQFQGREGHIEVKGEVTEHTGKAVTVEHVPWPSTLAPIESRNFVADTEPLWQAAGFRAMVTLEQGLRLTIEYFSQAEGQA